MSADAIISKAKADGVLLALKPTGAIIAIGRDDAVCRWLPLIRAHKSVLLEALGKRPETGEVLQWLARIGETDPEIIRGTLTKCMDDPDALRFFLKLAREEDTGPLR